MMARSDATRRSPSYGVDMAGGKKLTAMAEIVARGRDQRREVRGNVQVVTVEHTVARWELGSVGAVQIDKAEHGGRRG